MTSFFFFYINEYKNQIKTNETILVLGFGVNNDNITMQGIRSAEHKRINSY